MKKNIVNNSRLLRLIWNVIWLIFFRTSPRPFHSWRCFLLKLFGASIESPAYVYPTSKIWAPWNLTLKKHACLADNVECYCVDKIIIGEKSTVSQYSYLCTGNHDYTDPSILETPVMPLTSSPIIIEDMVWITAGVFIAPGVIVKEGAVVLARSTVIKNLEPWSVYAGNPAKFIKKRVLRNNNSGN